MTMNIFRSKRFDPACPADLDKPCKEHSGKGSTMRNVDCEQAQEWIVAKLDESLDGELQNCLAEHVAGCEACKEVEGALQDIWSALVEEELDDPGEAYWQDYYRSLNAKLDEVSLGWWRWWGFWRIGWKAAAVLAPATLVLALMFLGSNRETVVQKFVDDQTCHRLLVELNEVYGPTTEEIVPKAYDDRVRSKLKSANLTATEGSMLTWFEVEDDPTAPYL